MDEVVKKKKLNEVLTELEDAVSATSLFFSSLDKSDLPLVLSAFGQLKGAKDRLESSSEFIRKIYDHFSYEVIPDLYEATGTEAHKTDGKNYILNIRLDASIPADKSVAGLRWIREVAKVPELIKETVNPRSLSALVKERLAETGELPPEDAVSVHQKRYISVRKG